MAGYLSKAQERINRSIGQRVKKGQRDIARRYAQSLNEVRAQLGKVYQSYEQDGVLTFEEMAKFDRLKSLFQEIDWILQRNYKDLYNAIYDVLGFTYAESHDLTAWAIENEAKTRLGYSVASATAIKAAVEAPIDKLTLPQRLEQNRKLILAKIRQEMTLGLVKGETYKAMAERIKPALEGDTAKAMRVVRTEAHRVQEGGKLDAVKYANKQGVRMMKQWNTSDDERVRRRPRDVTDHTILDGVTLQIDDDFKGVKGKGSGPGHLHHPAEDVNCRCFLTYEIAGIENKPYNDFETTTFDKWRQETTAG